MDTQRLAENWLKLPTNLSTWVVFAAAALIDYWLKLTPEEQAGIIAAYPFLKSVGAWVGFGTFVLARIYPQGKPPAPAEVPAMSEEQAAKLLALLGQASSTLEGKKAP